MKIFIVGGTGLLGSEAAKELIKRGHQVTSLALPPIPMGANLPPEMELTLGNYLTMSDDELNALQWALMANPEINHRNRIPILSAR